MLECNIRISAVVAATLMLGGCAGLGDVPSLTLAANEPPPAAETGNTPQSELERAVEYWGKQYAKNPRDVDAALAYAKNLKALGQKGPALQVLQQISTLYGTDRRVTSEYGRLALELDQVSLAEQLLAAADDPGKPDWRVISARGTVLAKQGKYSEAVPYYERALGLNHDQPSLLNNLALAHLMSGNAAKAEPLLRQALRQNGADDKVRQNLALVLGAEGRHEEAKQVAATSSEPDAAAYNSDLLRRLVKASPNAAPTGAAPQVAAAAKPYLKSGDTAAAPTSGWQSRVADADNPQPASEPARGPAD